MQNNVQFQRHSLPNGLQVILYRDNRVPLVHVSLHYRVGSSYEERGRSGLAHLLEHMMFEGSENVGKNEHGKLLDAAGGSWNASTGKDRTNYYETVPSNHLELALWLEADRMRSLAITPSNFENQRQTVIEEKKQSYDNRPYGKSQLRFDELAYSSWAYAHPIIGSVEDLQALRHEDALDFHRRFYGPGNTVLVVAGDITEDQALEQISRLFGPLEDGTRHFSPDLNEPPQESEKRELHRDPLAALPAIMLGFHMPELGTDEYYALAMLSLVLTHGESSRLYRKMIYDNNWVTSIHSGPNQYRGPGLFTVWCQLQEGPSPEDVLGHITAELQVTGERHVEDRELEKSRNNISLAFLDRLTRVSQIGESLAHYAVLLNEPELINLELDRFFSVTAENIRNAAAKVFRSENQTTILVEPGRRAR